MKMKSIFPPQGMTSLLTALLLVLGFTGAAQAQDDKFKVVYVQGKVARANGGTLQVGDQVDRNEKLNFDPQAVAAIYNARVGRIVLPETGQYADAMTASSSTGLATLRDEVVDSLRPRLRNGQYLVLGEQGRIDLYLENELLRQEQLEYAKFAVVYRHNGQNLQTNLDFSTAKNGALDPDYHLSFPAKGLFRDAASNPISAKDLDGLPMLVMTREKGTGGAKVDTLCFFNPVVPEDTKRLNEEVGVIIRALQASPNLTDAQRLNVVRGYLSKYYAPPADDAALKAWLGQQHSLRLN